MRSEAPFVLAVALSLLGCPPAEPPSRPPPPVAPPPAPAVAEPPPPPSTPPHAVTRVAAFWQHACAVRHAGDVKCWGRNSYGQLGGGTRDKIAEVVATAGLGDVVDVGVGRDFSCALLRGGTISCWGNNEDGQLGDGSGVKPGALSLRPVAVSGLADVRQLSTGEYHGCALDGGGAVRCWGNGGNGQIGSDEERAFGTPRSIEQLRRVREVASGASHVCVLESKGTVKCWGRNTEGQLGDGQAGSRIKPVFVKGLDDAVHIASGHNHSCAVRGGGGVVCWGDNKSKQLGPEAGAAPKRGVPVDVPGLGQVEQLAGGGRHTCARLRSGKVLCWGGNDKGQLGSQASGAMAAEPTEVKGISDATHISLGKAITCAVRRSGEALCWGAGEMRLGGAP